MFVWCVGCFYLSCYCVVVGFCLVVWVVIVCLRLWVVVWIDRFWCLVLLLVVVWFGLGFVVVGLGFIWICFDLFCCVWSVFGGV